MHKRTVPTIRPYRGSHQRDLYDPYLDHLCRHWNPKKHGTILSRRKSPTAKNTEALWAVIQTEVAKNLPSNFDRLEDNRMPERSIVIGLIKAKNPSQPAILMSVGLET